ncbi:DUF6192 family protein [Streptomyces sp. NPDC057686]|uniref:DUF6192 family protein n=1 Tax=Streptomyces sp. NPDC057686 TaxID=3346212 RepID=UPI0036C3F546
MAMRAVVVGRVSIYRYEQIVAELCRITRPPATVSFQFTVGDRALEIEPMRRPGPQEHLRGFPTVSSTLMRLAQDIGLACSSVGNARWTASKWPEEHRQASASFTVHRILALIEDEEERFAAILNPPAGKARWTADEANRRVASQKARLLRHPAAPHPKTGVLRTPPQNREAAATTAAAKAGSPGQSRPLALTE